MKHFTVILTLVVIPFFCLAQQTIDGSITHNGQQRDYILYIPANYTGLTQVPLLFNFHGYGSNANDQMWYGDFRSIADTAGFLIVHPEGSLFNGISHWNVGGWTVGSTVDDVGFTEALIDSLAAMYTIDVTRVYSTGMSNGGYMSFLLACQLSEKIAAIASVTGSMTPEIYNNSNPLHPTPILQMHGTADPTVPYNGAAWSMSIDDVLEYWVGYNNCITTPSVTALPDIDPNDGSTVELIVYDGGDNSVNVEHYKVIGGGHKWPGSDFGGAGTNHDINASEEIWNFFLKYDINGLIGTTNIETPDENVFNLNIYPNPTNSFIVIESDFAANMDFEVYSIRGKYVQSGKLYSNNQKIDLSDLPSNIYLLHVGNKSYKIFKTD